MNRAATTENVLLTGGTGWIGRNLLPHLHRPTITARRPERVPAGLKDQVADVIGWDALSGPLPSSSNPPFTSVINLMGESLADRRWTKAYKERIQNSRSQGTRHLVTSLLNQSPLPQTFISASAIGWYGDQGDREIDETFPASDDFLGRVCTEWESACQPLIEHGVRVVNLRLGLVLGPGGGALQKMLTPFRWGVGGVLGSGRQWMSWIHLDDLIQLILFALHHEQLSGPVNAVSPNPLTNREFTQALGRQLKRPTFCGVPQWALRTAFGEFATYLTASQRVLPQKAQASHFSFTYPTIEQAFSHILSP